MPETVLESNDVTKDVMNADGGHDSHDSHDLHYYRKVFPRKVSLWLDQVSRTFALSIKVLPPDLRLYVGVAYLVCRILDTIEDAADIPVAQKQEHLDTIRSALVNKDNIRDCHRQMVELTTRFRIKESEKNLLLNFEPIFHCLYTFPENVRQPIVTWACEMASGMQKYAFGEGKPDVQLKTLDDLEQYTYYVAGTVGKMLSGIYGQEEYKIPRPQVKKLEGNSIQFGKALQLVNIIKDSKKDIDEGRCYIPEELMKKHHVEIGRIFHEQDTTNWTRLFSELIDGARRYLENSLTYIRAIPTRMWRLRLSCIWPVALAFKTLLLLERNLSQFAAGPTSFKLTRKDVKRTLFMTFFAGFSNRYFEFCIRKLKHV